jgi:mono/diheme cytochrome c family protein
MERIVVMLAALLIAFAVVRLPAAPAPADAAAGKGVYAKKCAVCHGPDGVARESMAKMLKVEIKPLGSKEVQALKDEELKKVCVEGKGKMKGVAGMSDAEIADLIAYLRTLKK